MKKFCLLIPAFVLIISACQNPANEADEGKTKTGSVTFFNESSYMIAVHQGVFSGPVLIELSSGQSKRVDIRISDNYGVGSTFCIEYRYKVVDGAGLASGEVWAYGIDPNVQINRVIEKNKTYTIQIPQPHDLDFPIAFVKIVNTSTTHFELAKQSTSYKQTGNGALSVPPGKTGVYKIESTSEGLAYNDFSVVSVFNTYPVPAFTAQNSYIYNFTYDGSRVTPGQSQQIIFH
jgi:hypothetical protein